MTRISIGICFWTTCATVTGTVWSPRPRPPPPVWVAEAPSPEHALEAIAPSASAPAESREMRRGKRSMVLFKSQRVDRVERCRFPCGIKTEEHANGGRKAKGDDDGIAGHGGRPALPECDALRKPHPEGNPDPSAEEAQDNRFDEELKQDVAAPCADRHAQADLARSLGDG